MWSAAINLARNSTIGSRLKRKLNEARNNDVAVRVDRRVQFEAKPRSPKNGNPGVG
jgi:hypothetical protein